MNADTSGIFLDRDTLGGDVDLEPLRKSLAQWHFLEVADAQASLATAAGAAVIVTNKVPVNEAFMRRLPALRLICAAATGTDHIDVAAARRRGIEVCNVRGYATPSVVQHVFALALALATRLPEYHDAVRAGRWQRATRFSFLDHTIIELAGKKLGIVGHGELGRAVARTARCFGMEVMIATRRGAVPAEGRCAFEQVLREADILSLHCPLTEETRGLIGARELGMMRPGTLLINTARGGLVDEAALAAALRAGRIAGAAVDVLSSEPPRADNPLLAPDVPGLIVTPHMAWASREARQRLIHELRLNVEAWTRGEVRNRIE
ncbi:MAG: D-2-hydroxyacid dehydrogenase [Gammaproteobacteria bacterium]|jgi:glycerate dehydrogenase|nr:D-2-hydroxyacid dehydrogenase [Gammaproteobacteria bacterium]